MDNPQSKDCYVVVEGIRTHYWVAGEGPSTVILIHGLGGYVENWESNIQALARGRRVYALDLPGFGRSDKPDIRVSFPFFAGFVSKFMQVLGIQRASLVGESMGGGVALTLALQYPGMVEKLVLAGSAGFGMEVSFFLRLLTVPLVGELVSIPSRQGSADFYKQIFINQDGITPEIIERDYALSKLPGAQRSLLRTLRSLGTLRRLRPEAIHPILDHLGEIQAPALILWGDQDPVLPVAHAHEGVKRLPNARLHIFERCGHVPNIEKPAEFNQLVNQFLIDS